MGNPCSGWFKSEPARNSTVPRIVLVMLVLSFGVVTLLSRSEGDAAFPGANGDLVIVSERDGDNNIWRIDSDGGSPVMLTTVDDNFDPTWSPDGTKIAFTRAVPSSDDEADIWVMNADGTGQAQLTDDPGREVLPTWSADGSKIAFRRGSTPEMAQIWVMDSNGENQTMLIDLPGTDSSPAFSPDGSQLAFSHRPFDEDFEIYVADVDGSNPVALTNNSTLDSAPAWSPDSGRIAYECTPEDSREVCVMDADGEDQANLTNDPANDETPAWSPDGTLIVFSSGRSDPGGIFTMEPDGENVQPVSALEDFDPDWQPLAPPQQVAWGDNNCSGSADPIDGLLTLRHDAGLPTETGDCPEMGDSVEVQGDGTYPWGDLDCSGVADPVDGLKVLRFDAGLDVARPNDCPGPGATVTIGPA